MAEQTVKLTIDGKAVEALRGTNIIEAAKSVGIEVPHYCYHPKLPVVGNCRMCLVEFGTPALGPDRKPVVNPDGTFKIAKSPRPAIGCATPISAGVASMVTSPVTSILDTTRWLLRVVRRPGRVPAAFSVSRSPPRRSRCRRSHADPRRHRFHAPSCWPRTTPSSPAPPAAFLNTPATR